MNGSVVEEKLAAVDQRPKDIFKTLLWRLGSFDMRDCGCNFVIRRRPAECYEVKFSDRVFDGDFILEESGEPISLVGELSLNDVAIHQV